ncbi:unnamed protein product [Pleuronectes platessa]|uniref:Uncharacterized protein n=1 Tax=Pleuronectes platessa TaxID=8262 RepID=A0A9N7U8L3_PLEPL|nr:unnamed protein product [Pleuronectes platessa]
MKRKVKISVTFFKKRSVNQRETEEVETQKDSQSVEEETQKVSQSVEVETQKGQSDVEVESQNRQPNPQRTQPVQQVHMIYLSIEVTAQVNQSGRDSPELSRVELGEVST